MKIVSVKNLSRADFNTANGIIGIHVLVFCCSGLSCDSFIHDLAVLTRHQASQEYCQPLKLSSHKQMRIDFYAIRKKVTANFRVYFVPFLQIIFSLLELTEYWDFHFLSKLIRH